MKAYLSMGSNVGDRAEHLRRATAELSGVSKVSSIYETEPADFIHQAWFLNCVAEIETDLPAADLLLRLQAMEQRGGRVRSTLRGPRTLDIDILFYGDHVISTPNLTIPHPRLAARRFVLEPLAEIAPDFVHPVTGQTVAEMLAQSTDPLAVRKAS